MHSPWTLCASADGRMDKNPLGSQVRSGGDILCAAGQKLNATMPFDLSLKILAAKTREPTKKAKSCQEFVVSGLLQFLSLEKAFKNYFQGQYL